MSKLLSLGIIGSTFALGGGATTMAIYREQIFGSHQENQRFIEKVLLEDANWGSGNTHVLQAKATGTLDKEKVRNEIMKALSNRNLDIFENTSYQHSDKYRNIESSSFIFTWENGSDEWFNRKTNEKESSLLFNLYFNNGKCEQELNNFNKDGWQKSKDKGRDKFYKKIYKLDNDNQDENNLDFQLEVDCFNKEDLKTSNLWNKEINTKYGVQFEWTGSINSQAKDSLLNTLISDESSNVEKQAASQSRSFMRRTLNINNSVGGIQYRYSGSNSDSDRKGVVRIFYLNGKCENLANKNGLKLTNNGKKTKWKISLNEEENVNNGFSVGFKAQPIQLTKLETNNEGSSDKVVEISCF
ncbi:hypothetical protein [Mycoplasma parvum]|uniref:Uncharacterized protein n=1 Tax=Mycoplasma parvum str. Indiana TaxID=1403316 RepID=U5NG77_9MOLU|nr:hypothetical protein [Mycoplasma parvum]AGX89273.1 hypothetical protein PRV_02730 [Mycoplasma parvum str. Indiana]